MNIQDFSQRLTAEAVSYQDKPFILRSGEPSHWYVDHRVGLAYGDMMWAAGNLLVAKAREVNAQFVTTAGAGVGGIGLAVVTAWAAGGQTNWAIANLDKTDTDPENGYGLYGAKVEDKEVLAVDDIGSSGGSLIELIEMVREKGGIVADAITVSDRSKGRAAAALSDIGVRYHSLLEFVEDTGQLVPIV